MATEDVCIILNERESAKEKIAETLLLKLKSENITASRLAPDSKLEKIINQRSPKIIVLDYLIGEFTTGLDLLGEFAESDDRPEFIFLTDEPSVHAAVEAMRLGARNYVELSNPEAPSLVLSEVREILKQRAPRHRGAPLKEPLKLKNFVGQASKSLSLLDQARSLTLSKLPLTIIYGSAGSGKSALANGIFIERASKSFHRNYDWDLCTLKLSDITGIATESEPPLKLGQNLSLTIDHVDLDDGGLLEFIETHLKEHWTKKDLQSNDSFLTIATSSIECARVWQKIFGAPLLEIPDLKERKEDIPPLARVFISEAQSLSSQKIALPVAKDLSLLSDMEWPGNLKQLRGVIIDAALISNSSDKTYNEAIKDSYDRSIEQLKATNLYEINTYTVAKMVERCGGNVRIAAASLGIPVYQAKSIIQQSSFAQDQYQEK